MTPINYKGIIKKKEQDFFPLYGSYGYMIIGDLKFYTKKEIYYKYRLGIEVELEYIQTSDGRFINNIKSTGKDLYTDIRESVTKVQLTEDEKNSLKSVFKLSTYLQAGFLSLFLTGISTMIFFSLFEFSKHQYYLISFILLFFAVTIVIRNSWVSTANENLKFGHKFVKISRLEEIYNNKDEESTSSVICINGKEEISFNISMYDDFKFYEHSHFAIHYLKTKEILSVYDLNNNLLIKIYK